MTLETTSIYIESQPVDYLYVQNLKLDRALKINFSQEPNAFFDDVQSQYSVFCDFKLPHGNQAA